MAEENETYLDSIDGLSDEDREFYTKKNYPDLVTAMKSGADTSRKVGKSVHWPDDKTSDDDRANFDTKVHEYQGVPSTKEDYQFERGEIPDELYDNELEDNFRQWSKDNDISQTKAAGMHKAWSASMMSRHQTIEDTAKKAEVDYRKELGKEADVVLGVPGDKNKIGKVKETLIQLSKHLKMDYTDDKGDPQSHLLDALELRGKNGSLGDRPAIAKVIMFVHENFFAEGKTFAGEPPTGKPGDGKPKMFSKEWYDQSDSGNEE